MSVGVLHWQPPDAAGDIAHQAWRPGAAAPRSIHVRPELHRRIAVQAREHRATCVSPGLGALCGVPLVVDDELPTFPGFEIHRVPPSGVAAW
jgi:hypothetical protein